MKKSMSIRTKVFLLVVLASFLLVGFFSAVTLYTFYNTKIEDEFSQLHALNVSEKNEIESIVERTKALLLTLSRNSFTQQSMEAFDEAFSKLASEVNLDPKLLQESLLGEYKANYLSLVNYDIPNSPQKRDAILYMPKNPNAQVAHYIFIANNRFEINNKNNLVYDPQYNCGYMEVHKLFHENFDRIRSMFGFYDIFLINLKGDIVYTDFKEKDFATNLKHGVYKRSALADAYQKALTLHEGEVAFSDFKPYEPSYNVPAAFLATPIYKDDKMVGVIALQISVENLNRITSFNNYYDDVGLGKTGESYLVGEDYKMRTDGRFIETLDDPIVRKLQTTIGLLEVKTKITQDAFERNISSQKIITYNYRGKKVLSVYHTINIYDQAKWVLVTEIEKDEVVQPIYGLMKELVFMAIAIFGIFMLAYLWLINKIMIHPLESLHGFLMRYFDFVGKKSKSIELQPVSSDDEIGKITQAVNENIILTREFFAREEASSFVEDGIAKLNLELMQLKSAQDILQHSLEFVCRYIGADIGVVYKYDNKDEVLEASTFYSVANQDPVAQRYKLGEGVVGDVAKSAKMRVLHLPMRSDIEIQTATVSLMPQHLLLAPLEFQKEVLGVVEVGLLHEVEQKAVDFVVQSSSIIAIALSSALKNKEVEELLDVAQKANLELEKEREKLYDANAMLEEQQQELEEANVSLESQKIELVDKYKELEKVKSDLQKSSAYKSEFLANMSHELRTPLNSIILLSELLSKNKVLSEEDIKKAKVIHKAGSDLLLLINDILDLSKIESGHMEFVNDQVESQELAEDMQHLFEAIAQEKGISYRVIDNFQGTFTSDRLKLAQVLKNLLSNALKFTKEGFVELYMDKEGDHLVFEVRDSGIGIPKEKQESIFDSFKQVDGSISREFGGTGLGLAISKSIVEKMGGTITLSSIEGEGSVFRVTIPLKQHHELLVVEPQSETVAPVVVPQEDEDIFDVGRVLEGKNVLIVDDDSRNIFALTAILEEMGGEVYTAFNGQEALEILEEEDEKIDVVLMDLMMPVKDGLSAIKDIRAQVAYDDVLIVVVSAKGLPEDKQAAFEAGADEYITKPVDANQLKSIFLAWLKQ